MARIIVYGTRVCPYCRMAEQLLIRKGILDFEKILLDDDPEARAELMARTRRRTIPQIFIGETHVGGFDDLSQLERSGRLDELVKSF